MPKKKTQKKIDKKVKKTIKKKSLIKRINEYESLESKGEVFDKVKTEIVITDGVVIVNPIYNPFDENNKD
jgi:FMN-dependent NADH-azoreductase